jgi:non-heme chloroperoxidase
LGNRSRAVGLSGVGGTGQAADSRSFVTSDGARLHYLEAGPVDGRTVIFVPGWTMPAWIFDQQIVALETRFHVLALDPRGQGLSEVAPYGYAYQRRGRDIAELIDRSGTDRVVVVGWSLGVLDSLAMLAAEGDGQLAGLVLIDNSIGEEPAPTARPGRPSDAAQSDPADRASRRAAFVAGLFARDPGTDYRARLTADAMRMSPVQEQALLRYDVPRRFWRNALHSSELPVLYVVRPRWRAQGETLVTTHADARMAVFEQAGHALFVDAPDRFNVLLTDFLNHRARWEPQA